jgi:hypothetical protein
VILLSVLLFALALVLGLLLLVLLVVVVVLRGRCVRRRAFVVVDHRPAGQPAHQQRGRDQQHAGIAKAFEKACYQVTLSLPTLRIGSSVGPLNICAVKRVHPPTVAVLVVLAIAACGQSSGTGRFTVGNARVDPTFTCPNPADNFAYDVHGTLDVDNSTGNTITIDSMSATTTTVAIHGSWLGRVGEANDEPDLSYSPFSVGPGSKATVSFAIPFECTDTRHTGVADTYGEFSIHITVVTSAGLFELDANKHRLITP